MEFIGHAIVNYVGAHWEAFTAAGTVLGIALVSCMPPLRPRSVDDWYDYIRHALQTAIPAARAANPPQVRIQTSQITADSTKTEDSTYPVAPLAAPADPANQK